MMKLYWGTKPKGQCTVSAIVDRADLRQTENKNNSSMFWEICLFGFLPRVRRED